MERLTLIAVGLALLLSACGGDGGMPSRGPIRAAATLVRTMPSKTARFPQPPDEIRRRRLIRLGNDALKRAGLILCCGALSVSGCSTRAIDIICPPAGVCPNTRSGHGGGY